MAQVKGIGGIFFRGSDPGRLSAWYREQLGVPVEAAAGCAVFRWREHADAAREQATVWSVFERESDYFENPHQQFMVNYIVESLDETLAELRGRGVRVEEKVEESEFGRFGWIWDPDGNRIELWQPPR